LLKEADSMKREKLIEEKKREKIWEEVKSFMGKKKKIKQNK
jgi:hypothetical protein